jgi:hypothetical protein
MIAFSRTFAGVMVALPHRSGMFPFRVSTPTSAFLDWLFMLVKEHVMCIFNVRVVENFGRIKVSLFVACHLSYFLVKAVMKLFKLCSKGTKAGILLELCGCSL